MIVRVIIIVTVTMKREREIKEMKDRIGRQDKRENVDKRIGGHGDEVGEERADTKCGQWKVRNEDVNLMSKTEAG